jgi:hypothetical protein
MCNERTELLRGEKEWPDALRRRVGRIVPAHKFNLSQYPLAGTQLHFPRELSIPQKRFVKLL